MFGAFSKPIAQELSLAHLRAYRCLYSGTEEELKTSFDALWAGCEMNYPSTLSPEEKSIYTALLEPDASAFRILRDLARRHPTQCFHMACDHLAERIAEPGTVNGWRLLKYFQQPLQIIAVRAKGSLRAKGRRGEATFYCWLLPVPASQTKTKEQAPAIAVGQ